LTGEEDSATRAGGISESGLGLDLLLLLAALATAAIGQGGYYRRVSLLVAILLLVAFALLLARAHVRDLRPCLWVVAGLGVAAGCAVMAGAVDRDLSGTLAVVAVLVGFAVIAMVSAATTIATRRQFADLLVLLGCVLAVTAWVGVAFRVAPLAHPDAGLWRAATTVTYENAAAAVLSMLTLWAIARVTAGVDPVGRPAIVLLSVGLGATLSRAGVAGFAAGLVVLVLLLGAGRVWRSSARALLGGLIALAGLAPGIPSASSPRPAWALLALVLGLVIGGAPIPRWIQVRLSSGALAQTAGRSGVVIGVMVFIAAGATVVAVAGHSHQWTGRLGLSSPARSSLASVATHMWLDHPVTGVGPGRALFEWTTPGHALLFDRYAHDEYLQTADEQGALGIFGLAAIGAGIVATLAAGWRSGPRPADRRSPVQVSTALRAGAVAGLVGLAVHSGFDFLWHVPVVLMIAAVAVGIASPVPLCEIGATTHQVTTEEVACSVEDG
jgi:hypothetical protein